MVFGAPAVGASPRQDPELLEALSKNPAVFSDMRPIAIVRKDKGGYMYDRQRHLEQVRQRGQKIAIVGKCASACTFYLDLGPDVCVSPNALLGFHGPTGATASGVFSPIEGDRRAKLLQEIAAHYPPPIRRWFMAKAANLSGTNLVWVSGKDIIKQGVASCKDWGVR